MITGLPERLELAKEISKLKEMSASYNTKVQKYAK